MWHTIRTFHTARFSVALQWAYEEHPDSSWWDSATRNAINEGRLNVYCFRTVVSCDGREIAADYLSDSVYEDPADFACEHRKGAAYFPDMLRSAVSEARKTLHNQPRVRT